MDLSTAKFYMGIWHRCTEEELKSQYRKRAKELHPDVNGGGPQATQQFQMLGQAYTYLKNNMSMLPSPPKPQRPRPQCETIFRMFDKNREQIVNVPQGCLEDDDLCLYFFWKGQEYRTVVKKGTNLPMLAHISDEHYGDLYIQFVREEFPS